jgi:hypothetical protein
MDLKQFGLQHYQMTPSTDINIANRTIILAEVRRRNEIQTDVIHLQSDFKYSEPARSNDHPTMKVKTEAECIRPI